MYSGMFRIGRESLKRDSRNTFGKSEEFSVKNRCVALRCVALQRVKSGDQLLALANFAAGAKRRAKREGSTGIR